MQTGLFVLIFSVMSRTSLYGMSTSLFIVTGVVPYFLFSGTFGKVMSAVKSNRDLFMHPRIQVLDVIVARAMLEFIASLIVFVCFLIILGLFVEQLNISNPLMILINY